jgi:two-component system, OmpR family, sensor kinase
MLRKDVTLLTQPPPADPAITPQTPDLRFETTLNALDGAIDLLTELESGPALPKRRGRIDLVALLMELSPGANLSFEPGAGTEVAGDESEFRRMLHVLVGQASSAAGGGKDTTSAVHVRREGDWVRVTANLGPDVSASSELERRWLSRMAVRLGGRLDLEGGTMSLVLPADASSDQSEMADLRKELEQAQQLGEAYARELAAVFAAGQLPEVDAASDRRDVATRRFELLVSLASAVHRELAPLIRGLKEHTDRGGPSPAEGLVSIGLELSSELGRVAQCPTTESTSRVDLARIVQEAAAAVDPQAARRRVTVDVDAPASIPIATKPAAASLLVHALLDHAILATPAGSCVRVSLRADDGTGILLVADGGPPIPAPAHADLLEHHADPAAFGRPTGPALVIAQATAAYLGTRVKLGEGADGTSVVETRFGAA